MDPFTVAVLQESLIGIAGEMKAVTMKTAYTQIWKEQGDLSCCLMNANGEIVAQDPTGFPGHITTMPYQLQGTLRCLGRDSLVPGDVLMTNDPYIGGTHLPDVMIARPLFWASQLYGFACNRGHWADIGGMGPGSYSASTPEIYQEGLFVPPVKLFEAGEPNDAVIELVLGNVRNRSNAYGDLRAQYSSCHTAQRRVEELIQKYGLECLLQVMDEVLTLGEAKTRQTIASFPDGVYHYRDCLDGDGLSDVQVWVDLALTIDGDELIADYSGSSRQSSGGINCSHSATASGIQYAVKCMSDPDSPPNSGSYRPIRVITRPGTVLDAQPPAAMVGFGEISLRAMDVAFGALTQVVPNLAVASGSGSTGVVVVGGRRSVPGRKPYFYALELSSGAYGARPDRDGLNAIRYGKGNAGHIPIEADELENPLTFLRYEIVPDTGGPGRFRGGNGFCRVFRVDADDAVICITADRDLTPPPGILGGQAGACARYMLDPNTPVARQLRSKVPYTPLRKGTVVWLQSAGGGGLGRPEDRSPDLIRRDLKNGYVTEEHSRSVYPHSVQPDPPTS